MPQFFATKYYQSLQDRYVRINSPFCVHREEIITSRWRRSHGPDGVDGAREQVACAPECSAHGSGRIPPASAAADASRGVRGGGWNQVAPAIW